MNVVAIACVAAALGCALNPLAVRAESGSITIAANAAAVSSTVSAAIAGLSATSVSALPGFPLRAWRDGYRQGRVRLEYTVNADGSVGDVTVVEAFPVEVFTRTARKTVAAWQFVATGVSTRRSVEFEFRAD